METAKITTLRRGRARPLAIVLAGLLTGCATPGLPPAQPASEIAAEAIRRAQAVYLHPDRIDRRMLVGALDALERSFNAVRFEEGRRDGVLYVGTARARVPLEGELDPERFQALLGRALAFVEANLGEELREARAHEDFDLEMLAMRGALGALDRYSTIFSGRSTENFRIHFSGKLHGIGARIGRRDGRLLAIKVFPDSPAAKGGLRDDDAILAIDGESTQPLTVSQAVGRIRGPEGKPVTLRVLREDRELDLHIVRGEVRIPTVEARLLEDGIGYVRIETMSRATVREFRDKLLALGELRGLLLDLRGNTGGSMQTATQLADLFLAEQTIVRVVERRDPESRQARNRTQARPEVLFDLPVIVLVDPATASAAEIVAGSLAPLPSVQLVGQTTFGKGVVQRVLPLPDQKLLKLTVAEYLLSEDRAIHEKGLDPDITLFPVSTERLGRLAHVDPDSLPYVRDPEEDDDFPIEVGRALLTRERDVALRELRQKADERIREALEPYGVEWREPPSSDDDLGTIELRVRWELETLRAGEPGTLRVQVENPAERVIPRLWLALDAPTEYLSNKLVALGTLEPGGSVSGEIELSPPHGIAVREHPVVLHLASGAVPLQDEDLVLQVAPRTPDLEIRVGRLSKERIEVAVENRGRSPLGELRIDVPGASHTVESIEAGGTVEKELLLSGEVEYVSVTLMGPWVRRRIDVPLPEAEVSVRPPRVVLERTYRLGRARVRVHANSSEGLDTGWIALDGQKQSFVSWSGEASGEIQTGLDHEASHNVIAHVETVSGVAVTDSRQLTAD
ncbi:MAG: S41 family peptidase [Myxococcota bacterium]